MNAWKLFTAVGAGVTTALLVAVVIIELLQIEFSALVGLPVGVITGIIVTVWLGDRSTSYRSAFVERQLPTRRSE
ncbi:hypothetical protein ACFQH2_13795 [Natronoarchaeum sp. GCM10025703]|uniref:hypothetical protein n=1 Tax=Natronoarchaeum sp. GCM10025703 TaxID=3252685 RepID=UPI00360D0032